jgi:hypothetical protein
MMLLALLHSTDFGHSHAETAIAAAIAALITVGVTMYFRRRRDQE